MGVAVIAGSTGAIGRHLVAQLAQSPRYGRVIILHHRPVTTPLGPMTEVRVVDFGSLDEVRERPDAVFCCVGTTQRKAGSTEAFQKVDRDVPIALARWAAANGTPVFVGISSIAADAHSGSVYLRTKGEMEDGVRSAGLRSAYILRPSLLAGEREEYRLAERIANSALAVVGPLMLGPLRKYRAVQTKTVARAMLACAREQAPGVHVVESDRIQDLGA